MRLHTLAGLPRSGSTLVANILAQHPDVSVTGTSALSTAVEAVTSVLSNAPEVKSDLTNVPGSRERYAETLRSLIKGWHSDAKTPVVIDKGRGWAMHRLLLDQIFPKSITIMCVRDPRDVIASIEKQHRATGMFNHAEGRTVYEMADRLMSPEGIVGGPLRFTEDLIRRNLPSVEWIPYETFIADPLPVLHRLEKRLGLKGKHTWDIKNVVNVATDLDTLYLNKYPHVGSGAIKPSESSWSEFISPDLADLIAGVAPLYMQTFGYQAPNPIHPNQDFGTNVPQHQDSDKPQKDSLTYNGGQKATRQKSNS